MKHSLRHTNTFSKAGNSLPLYITKAAREVVNRSFEKNDFDITVAVTAQIIDSETGETVIVARNMAKEGHDASDHGEINAIRQAHKKFGQDLSGYILITNCQQCPMCAAATIASGIKNSYHVNTIEQARSVGWPDLELYKHMSLPFDSLDIEYLEKTHSLHSHIQDSQSAIVHSETGEILTISNSQESKHGDATLCSQIIAIQTAGKILERENLSGYSLISKKTPPAVAYVASKWANLDNVACFDHEIESNSSPIVDPWFIYKELATLPEECKFLSMSRVPNDDNLHEKGYRALQNWLSDIRRIEDITFYAGQPLQPKL